MAIEKLKPDFQFDEERIKKLYEIVPEAFADGKINWHSLQEALGNYKEDDDLDSEHFGLFWPGKREARRLSSLPSKYTLIPVPEEGIDHANSNNVFIEGDNLEVLKLLQKNYAGLIKMIYIDPPYNTGKDFVYDDDFKESVDAYLKTSGQLDEENKSFVANVKSDGRFHSKWLSMMYPRLRLARNLLKDDGLIFISIDDNEIHNLRQIMNEIFGEASYVGTLKRRAARKTAHLSASMSDLCDYVVVYCKSFISAPLSVGNVKDTTRPVFNQGNSLSTRVIKADVECRCKDGIYKQGTYKVKTLEFELLDDLTIENGKSLNDVVIKGPWRINQDVLDKTVYFTKNFGLRRYLLPEEMENAKSINDLIDDPQIYNELGSEAVDKLFGFPGAFENPKPPALLDFLIRATEGTDRLDDFIILDFFAGSGTTGHSIIENHNSEISKKFILVQLDEPISQEKTAFKKGFKYISDLTKFRLRAISKAVEKKDNIKIGFKAFKLNKSNYKNWDNYAGNNVSELEGLFDKHVTPLIDEWTPANLLFEIMLLEGFPLDSSITSMPNFTQNTVTHVTSQYCDHSLIVCLDNKIDALTIKHLHLDSNDIFICLDSAISDKDKATLDDKGLIKTI